MVGRAAGDQSATAKRLLLIAYHFGQGAETGAFRWNAMARHLVQEGWTIDVISIARDNANDATLPAGIHVTRVPLVTWPNHLLGAISSLKRALVRRPASVANVDASPAPVDVTAVKPIPVNTPRSLGESLEAFTRLTTWYCWARDAGRAAVAMGRKQSYQALVVSSPPHLSQLAGLHASKRLRIPLVSDFRDPWIFGHAHATWRGPDRKAGELFEPRVMHGSRRIVCNTEHAAQAVRDAYPALRDKVLALPNGYDDESHQSARPDSKFFRVVWAGTFYRFMDVPALLAACGRFRKRFDPNGDVLRVTFMGCEAEFAGVPLQDLAESAGLSGCFELRGRGTQGEARELQESGAVLVCYDVPSKLAVAVKFYEFVRMYGSILAIGEPDSALGVVANAVGAAMVDPADDVSMDRAIDAAYERWKHNAYPRVWDESGQFARRVQSTRFADMLHEVSSS